MKKTLLIALAIIMAVTVFTACKQEEAAPSPTPTVIEATPEPPPDNISPTTGLMGTTTEYKPLVVQIGNEPHERPQQGLQQADIVYETLIEGTDTRFTAVYNDALLKADAPAELPVGPVRSSRYYHQLIQSEWDAVYVHMGGPDTTGNPESDIYGQNGQHIKQRISGAGKGTAHAEKFFAWREGKSMSDYAATDLISDLDVYEYEPVALQQFKFYPLEDYADAPVVDSVQLRFDRHLGWVTYQYDETKSKLLRYLTSSDEPEELLPFTDLDTEQPIEVQNLIVQYTYVNIMPSDLGGRRKVDMYGSGKADFVINGRHVPGTWERAGVTVPTTYKDMEGNEITFTPGNTWVAVHPMDKTISIAYKDGTAYESTPEVAAPKV